MSAETQVPKLELELLRSYANSFLGYAMTARAHCTEEWLAGLVHRGTVLAHHLGENGRFVRDKDWITWQDESV